MYQKESIEICVCRCEKCGYNWQSKKFPSACAKCKSSAWNSIINKSNINIEIKKSLDKQEDFELMIFPEGISVEETMNKMLKSKFVVQALKEIAHCNQRREIYAKSNLVS